MDTERIYMPSIKRMLCFYYLLPIAASILIQAVGYLPDILQGQPIQWTEGISSFIGSVGALTIMSFLMIGLNRDWLAIKMDANTVSGPTIFGGRKSIQRDQIDLKRTQQKNAWHRFTGSRQIWDIGGHKISLPIWDFSPEQIAEILAQVGARP